VLIDGIESKSGGDKVTYECACLDKETQDIIWGFVLSEDNETPPTPKPRDSPPPPVRQVVAPRVKVVMQRHRIPASALIKEVPLSDRLSVSSSRGNQPLRHHSQTKTDDFPDELDPQGKVVAPHDLFYDPREFPDTLYSNRFSTDPLLSFLPSREHLSTTAFNTNNQTSSMANDDGGFSNLYQGFFDFPAQTDTSWNGMGRGLSQQSTGRGGPLPKDRLPTASTRTKQSLNQLHVEDANIPPQNSDTYRWRGDLGLLDRLVSTLIPRTEI